MRRLFPFALILLLAASDHADTIQNTPLVYKAKAGESARYRSEGTLNMQAAGQKVTLDLKETEGRPGLSCSGTVWVEVASGDNIAAELEIDNLKTEMGGQEVTASGKVRGERLSGSPLGGGKAADSKAEKKEKTIDEVVK